MPVVLMTEREWLEIGRKSGAVEICRKSTTFAEIYKKWFLMKMRTVKPQTLDRIECTYNRYYKGMELETRQLHEIDTSYLCEYLGAMLLRLGQLTHKEYKRLYQILNNVLVYAYDLRMLGAQAIDWGTVKRYVPVQCIVPSNTADRVITDKTIMYLEGKVLNDKIYYLKQSACICLVLNFYLGLRVGELASLQWSDIDYINGVVHVHTTETKAYARDASGERDSCMRYAISDTTKTIEGIRDVPLTYKSVQLLQELSRHHGVMGYTSPYLAYDGTDTALVRSLDRTLRRLCKLCEILPFSTHMIRKTFASRLHDAGMSTRMISDLLGHREMSTTERYYILGYQDEIDRARNAMNTAFCIDSDQCSDVVCAG